MKTVDELRDCLHKGRGERQELMDELAELHEREKSARVRDILNSYQEKGTRDEYEHERNLREPQQSRGNPISPPARERSFSPYSPRPATPPSEYQWQSDDEREIYPHRRRSSSFVSRSRSVSPAARRYYSPGPDSSDLNDSFIDQTLHEIELEISRDREILRNSKLHRNNYLLQTTSTADKCTVKSESSGGILKDKDDFFRKRSVSSSPHRVSPGRVMLKGRERSRSRSPARLSRRDYLGAKSR